MVEKNNNQRHEKGCDRHINKYLVGDSDKEYMVIKIKCSILIMTIS